LKFWPRVLVKGLMLSFSRRSDTEMTVSEYQVPCKVPPVFVKLMALFPPTVAFKLPAASSRYVVSVKYSFP